MMSATMAGTELKRFAEPEEVRTFEKGKLELVHVGEDVIGRVTLEPGWRWSRHVKPLAGTEWCEAPHYQYVISGRLRLLTADGQEFDLGPGDCLHIGGGHDAWVVGSEPFVAVDWAGMATYAKS